MSRAAKQVSYRWEVFDAVPDAYRLRRMLDSVRTAEVEPGWKGDVVIARDINRERWLWGFVLRKGDSARRASGHAATRTEAEAAAEAALWPVKGKGAAGEEVRNSTTATP